MKHTWPAFWISALFACCAIAAPITVPATQSSPIVRAERIVQISGDPDSVQSALQTVQGIAGRRNGISYDDQALQKLLFELGMSVEGDDVSITVNFNQRQIDILVSRPPQVAALMIDAAKVANRVSDLLKNRFADAAASALAQANSDEEQMGHLQKLKDKRDSQQAALQKLTGLAETSPAVIRPRVDAMQSQRETDAIDLAAKQARSDALAAQIAKLSVQIQAKIKDDPIAAELQKASDARDKDAEFRKALAEKGVATQTDVTIAIAAAAEAKAKLLERQEAATAAAGGDLITTWNRELMTLSIDLAEMQARIKALDDRLAAYAQVHEYLDHAEQWNKDIAALEQQVPQLQGDHDNQLERYKESTIKWDIVSSKDESTLPPPASPATPPSQ